MPQTRLLVIETGSHALRVNRHGMHARIWDTAKIARSLRVRLFAGVSKAQQFNL
jgi:hypothetical protein